MVSETLIVVPASSRNALQRSTSTDVIHNQPVQEQISVQPTNFWSATAYVFGKALDYSGSPGGLLLLLSAGYIVFAFVLLRFLVPRHKI